MMLVLLLLQPVKWHESDECEKCASPFFWNLKLMWEAKTIGGRQASYWHLFCWCWLLFINEVLNKQLHICTAADR